MSAVTALCVEHQFVNRRTSSVSFRIRMKVYHAYTDRMTSPYTIALANVPCFGPRSNAILFEMFNDPQAAWNASADELISVGIRPCDVPKFLSFRKKHDPFEFAETMTNHGIRAITICDDEYPSLLKTIHTPPTLLFVKGPLPPTSKKHLAIVGSRHATKYGLRIAKKLAGDCANAGIVIVSGLAYGIDEASHRGTLEVNGITLAVLGSGFLGIDNPRHNELSEAILAGGGAIISEFPFRAAPLSYRFPIRNRIVAGMCHGTMAIEAGIPSGTLLTTTSATNENREVFAVPGMIDSMMSKGTNELLKNGAHFVTEARDIFLAFGMEVAPQASATAFLPIGRPPDEIALFAQLGAEPIHIDEAIEKAGLSTTAGSIALTGLELLGAIEDVGGKQL